MPRRLLGMNSNMIAEHLQFIDDPCLAPIDLRAQFPSVKHPFLWMSEIMDLEKEKSFFERRVTEYQGGALSWDQRSTASYGPIDDGCSVDLAARALVGRGGSRLESGRTLWLIACILAASMAASEEGDAGRSAGAQPAAPTSTANDRVCTREDVLGSHTMKRTVCRSRAQLESDRRSAQRDLDEIRNAPKATPRGVQSLGR
jgi:predicted secreted protein